MPPFGDRQGIERVEFFDGQRLFASDLRALEETHRRMRWLHNQSLHQPGVGNGYRVDGAKGAREVVVEPGYAIDVEGREIVLTERWTEPVPPVSDDGQGNPVGYDLVVSYPDDSELEESETREGVCVQRGVVRRREAPSIAWVELTPAPDLQPKDPALRRKIDAGWMIRLARAEVFNCQLHSPLSIAERRNARPPRQPYVACGDTRDRSWTVSVVDEGILLEQDVDTSDAGFVGPTCYYAQVAGDRVVDPGGGAGPMLLDGFVSVSAETPVSFQLSMFIPGFLVKIDVTTLADALETTLVGRWWVEWVGVED